MMRPFLILAVFALLATWLMWPAQEILAAAPKAEVRISTPLKAKLETSLAPPPAIERSTAPAPPQNPAVPKPEAPKNREEAEKPGRIFGKIVDIDGRPITEGRVLVFDRQELLATLPLEGDASEYSIELPAGKYFGFMAEPGSLPGSLLPAPKRSRQASHTPKAQDPLHYRHFTQKMVAAEAGQSKELNLQVSLLGKATGRVLDPSGNPVEGALIRIQGLKERSEVKGLDSITDKFGFFEVSDIAAGEFRLLIFIGSSEATDQPNWSKPQPQLLTFGGGQTHNLGDIYLGMGAQSIVGWVVNQNGDPFPERVVVCYSNNPEVDGSSPNNLGSPLTRVLTDATGRFELRGLDATHVVIGLTPDFYPGPAMGVGMPAMWEPMIEVDLSGGQSVQDIGEFVVHESRPFEISGDLIFDPAWLAMRGNRKKDFSITVGPVEGVTAPEGFRRNALWEQEVPIDNATDRYSYLLETPLPKARITFSLKGYPDLRFVIRPEALQSKSRTIHIPSDFVQ